jgi:hypothetical protein
MHLKMKHILIKYHFLREHVVEQNVKLEYITTKELVANIFTKSLARDTFEYLRWKLGVISFSSCQSREAQAHGDQPFVIDVKGGEVVDKGIIADTRKLVDRGSIIID